MITGNGLPETIAGLRPHHLADLRRSGLTDETIRANGIRSVDDHRNLAEMLNRQWSRKNGAALVFPYTSEAGDTILHRVKPDNPPKRNDKPQKYLQPSGVPPRPYFPHGVRELLTNIRQPIILTEGEKKSLAAHQAGFPCVSLPGVDTWHRKKSAALIPDLQHIEWNGRRAYICFDSDATDNENVKTNEILLAAALAKHGAIVRIVRIPAGRDGEKVGLDDFLVAHGTSEFATLLAKAEEPEPPTGDEGKANSAEIDPAAEAAAILEADQEDGFYRLRFYRGEFLAYESGRYTTRAAAEVRAMLICSLNRGYRFVVPGVTSSVLDQIRAQSLLPERTEAPAWLAHRKDDWPAGEIIAVANGLLHLPSQNLRAPTPRFFVRNSLGYKFRQEAPSPEAWLNFLDQLWANDPFSISTLQEIAGYLLSPNTSLQKIFMLIGPKRSGKGTVARVFRGLVGEVNVVAPTLASLATNFGLAPLLDKSLGIVSDARLSGRTDNAIVVERLLSISGEDPQTVDRKHLSSVTCKLPTRFLLLSNELPRLSDSSGAMASRMILLRLTESFYGREDHRLTDKLLAELPNILNWAIAGYQRLRERGRFVQPESASDLVGDLEDLGSPISAFVRECCITAPGYRASVADLYAEWRKWCERKGRREPGNEQTFGRDLTAALPALKRTQPKDDHGGRYRAYDGIGLIGSLGSGGF